MSDQESQLAAEQERLVQALRDLAAVESQIGLDWDAVRHQDLAGQVALAIKRVAELPASIRTEPAIADVMAALSALMARIELMDKESARSGRRQFWWGLVFGGVVIAIPVGLLTSWIFGLVAG